MLSSPRVLVMVDRKVGHRVGAPFFFTFKNSNYKW